MMGGRHNVQQLPPSSVCGDTERVTQKLDAAMMINSPRTSKPQKMDQPCNHDNFFPNSQIRDDAHGAA